MISTSRTRILTPATDAVHIRKEVPSARHLMLGMWAAGAIFFLGTLLDLSTLWILQRQGTPQWEFVALLNTAEAFPRLVLALSLVLGGMYFGGVTSLLAYRLSGLVLLLLGCFGGLVAGLVVADYLTLARTAAPTAMPVMQGVVFKGTALGLMYLAVLVPLGIAGLRRKGD